MRFVENDRWRGAFTVGDVGRYRFTARGWVDAFATWQRYSFHFVFMPACQARATTRLSSGCAVCCSSRMNFSRSWTEVLS